MRVARPVRAAAQGPAQRVGSQGEWGVLRRGLTGPMLPKHPLACLKTSSRQPGFAPCIDALENSASFPCTISCSFL